MRHPWHPRHPIIGLRRTRAESEGGSAQRTGDCRCTRDFLHIHQWSPFCSSPLPQLSGTAVACGLRQIPRPLYAQFGYPLSGMSNFNKTEHTNHPGNSTPL
jgi:hypothetical protein